MTKAGASLKEGDYTVGKRKDTPDVGTVCLKVGSILYLWVKHCQEVS